MVAPGSMGKYKPPKMTKSRYSLLLGGTTLFAALAGYMAATQPEGAGWRFFSWHPMLMVSGFVGMMGGAALTKKLGGYTNTKLHGIVGWVGLMMAFGGLYVIYRNKENMGKPHLTSTHSIGGIVSLTGCVVVGVAGGTLLHPDFGIAKKNKAYRFIHLWAGRIFLLLAWFSCFTGLTQLTQNNVTLAMFGLPLLALVPFTLM